MILQAIIKRRETYVDVRLSGRSKGQIDPERETDDPNSVSTDLRMILKQVERHLSQNKRMELKEIMKHCDTLQFYLKIGIPHIHAVVWSR